MQRIRVFISSVQTEFAEERQMLFDYLRTDALLGQFFEPFLFEKLPASSRTTADIYLKEVAGCEIYIGLFGKEYGSEDQEGISPTEREFDYACELHKTRLIFISAHNSTLRHQKELALIKKAEKALVRKKFSTLSELKADIYASLIRYLEEKEYIRNLPFDATLATRAGISDLDKDKIEHFVALAKKTRQLSLPANASVETVLTHLNLTQDSRIANAAILLFGKHPQRFFLTSEIKCAHFHGTEIIKPIPSYCNLPEKELQRKV